MQIRKRKKLIDQIRSMSDVWKKVETRLWGGALGTERRKMEQGEAEGNDTITDDERIVGPEGVESSGRKRSHDESTQTHDRDDGPDAPEHRRDRWNYEVGKLQESCKAGSALLFEWIRNESRPQMRVLQKKRDDEKTEEIRTLITDPEEIHEVIARAWQDILGDETRKRNRRGRTLSGTTNTCGIRNHRWTWVNCKSTR